MVVVLSSKLIKLTSFFSAVFLYWQIILNRFEIKFDQITPYSKPPNQGMEMHYNIRVYYVEVFPSPCIYNDLDH